MDFKKKIRHKEESELQRTLRGVRTKHKRGLMLTGFIGGMLIATGVWFGTPILSDPDVSNIHLLDAAPYVSKHVVVNEDSVEGFLEANTQTNDVQQTPGQTGSTSFGGWDNLCGYYWGKYPLELYILSTMCERGCSEQAIHECVGDAGQAYGLMQLDYRFDLIPFMQTSYQLDPVAWKGFEPFLSYAPGDTRLVGNQAIIDAFNFCYDNYPDKYMEIQPNFFVEEYLYCTDVQSIFAANNFNLEDHSIFVAAALLGCNINCGKKTGTLNFFKAGARNDMTDEELLNCVYVGWRMYRSRPRWAQHGARLAADKSGEEGVALQLLHGEIEVTTFDNSKTCPFGAGWDGPNAVRIASKGN